MSGGNDPGRTSERIPERTGQGDDPSTAPPGGLAGVRRTVRLRLGLDGDLELHPDTLPDARQAAHTRLSGVPLDTVFAARWGVPQLLPPPSRLRADVADADAVTLHAPPDADGWLCMTWNGVPPEPCPDAPMARPEAVTGELLGWLDLSAEDALSAAGALLQDCGVMAVELTDGLSLHQLILGEGQGVGGQHHVLLGTPQEPLGRMILALPAAEVPPRVHTAAWVLGLVARQARLGSEVRRKDHAAQRSADLQRSVLAVVNGDAPPEEAVYAATRLLHAQAGTLVSAHPAASAVPEAYGGWVTEQLRQQVTARLSAGGDARPAYAVMPADQPPVLIVPLPGHGVRRGAWVFQLSRRPWFLRPHVLDALLDAARHPVHLAGAWEIHPPGAATPAPVTAPRSVLGLLQHLGELDAPSAVAGQGLRYLASGADGAWGAYLGVRGGPEDGRADTVTLSSILRTGTEADHPRPAVVQSVVAAFWHTVGRAGGLSLSAPHPLLPPPLRRLTLAPVRSAGGDRVSGVLVVGDGPEDARADGQLTSLLAVLAQQVSQAAERQHALRQLSRAREQTFRVLGRALEYRSYETKGHTDRVTSLALKLGLQLDLTYGQLTVLRWGAYLHDIGKIAIPDAVLHKKGPLTLAERGQMHEHVMIGEALLREQDLVPEGVLEIVRHHHERWDGGGYPDGLSGDQIPLLARVFAVVDVYDALTSARTYKPSWTQERSVKELERLADHALDPHLTRVFTEMVRRGDLSTDDDVAALTGLSAD